MNEFWTNASVVALEVDDPEAEVLQRAQRLALEAVEQGWHGPPFDPFELARLRGLDVVPREDLYDARVVPARGGLRIEYNPTRPPARQRYSVAHEIAHTLFPDVRATVRYRSGEGVRPPDDWQLELLCNLAAAELLMPAGAFPGLEEKLPGIEQVLELRTQFAVSTEAVLLRIAKLARRPVAAFAAARTDGRRLDSKLRLDFLRGSRSWNVGFARGRALPTDTVLKDVTAIGYTAGGRERWTAELNDMHVEGVGLPPYPGQHAPRVAGLLRPHGTTRASPGTGVEHVRGDATQPRGRGPRVIAHVVNDRTPNWGGGFARALRQRYPRAQELFRASWSARRPRLGTTDVAEVEPGIWVASMVAQAGYGPSKRPRIRYLALRDCLKAVADLATEKDASVHMPRIGAGEAGGRWAVIEELVDETLSQQRIPTNVYSLPGERWSPEEQQMALPLS